MFGKIDKIDGFVSEDGVLGLWPFEMASESVTLIIWALTTAVGWSQRDSGGHSLEFVAIPT